MKAFTNVHFFALTSGKPSLIGLFATILCLALTACSGGEGDVAEGTFEATEVTVSAESNGRIMMFDAEEGDEVKAGAVVARIDDVQLVLQKRQLEAQQAQIVSQEAVTQSSQEATNSQREATLAQSPDITVQAAAMEQQLANLRYEKGRVERLLADGAATQKSLDDINHQIAVCQKQLSALRSSLQKQNASLQKQAESVGKQSQSAAKQLNSIRKQAEVITPQLAQLQDKIEKCEVRSPTGGTILVKYKEAGELATPGTPLFKVADMNKIYLRAYATSNQLENMKIGQKVKVVADYGGDKQQEYEGRIQSIASQSEFTPKTIQTSDSRANLVYAVKVAVKNDGRLKIGLQGRMILTKSE
ncbi:MAG: HlyD family efflux transporter periplasmic adaptor subunit [Bacteroidaceae bacterium]|nr:HlyD family efflux transporter periplasmic adaptor subunit [Bacteroidaceae bacterium]